MGHAEALRDAGSDITIVTWWSTLGRNVQKSQLLSALRRPVRGSRLIAWRLREAKQVAEKPLEYCLNDVRCLPPV